MRKLLGALVVVASAIGVPQVGHAGDVSSPTTPAWFEGEIIDLADGWGEATACEVHDDGTYCYRTEAEMTAAGQPSPRTTSSTGGSFSTLLVSCSTALRLYDGTSYTGAVLSLYTRGTYINLSAYSFDNKVSSYRVGSCGADFFSGSTGSGSVYPGSTWAWVQSPSMLSGWNNVVSSVYIY